MHIYYHQSSDEFCMHSHDLITGLLELGHSVSSNVCNYEAIQQADLDSFVGDLVIVSTSGNSSAPAIETRHPLVFVDGRDQVAVDQRYLERAQLYFKTNWDVALIQSPRLRMLPSCTLREQPIANQPRTIDASFAVGHFGCGREAVAEWLREYGRTESVRIAVGPFRGEERALHPKYPTGWCNIVSAEYYDVLARSRISVNAPGGGVNTKRFFEILAAGALCCNYVPADFEDPRSRTKTNGDILQIIPEVLGFPRECVVSFSTREELFEALQFYLSHPERLEAKAAAGQTWARSWTPAAKAAYLLEQYHRQGQDGPQIAPLAEVPDASSVDDSQSQPAVAEKPCTGVTIFTQPKAWTGQFAGIQRNAVRSWIAAGCHVILLGDEPGTAEAAAELGVVHSAQVEKTPLGTPLVNSVFAEGLRLAETDLVAYVNADILLFASFRESLQSLADSIPAGPFLMVGARWNLPQSDEWDFQDSSLESRLKGDAQLFRADAIDYFAFRRGLYDSIPPFALGRFAWDNWLVDSALAAGAPVVDASLDVLALHQDHPGTTGVHVGAQSAEVLANQQLYYGRFGYSLENAPAGGVQHAPHFLKGGSLRYRGSARQRLLCPSADADRNPDGPEQPIEISLCMIVRNNERTIRECLESIRPWVDEMVVVDTGSDDDTPRIAAELGARVFEFPWCDDFSAARNESLRHARGRWLFWMDSDDTIEAGCGWRLRLLASGAKPGVLGFVMQVHCPGPAGGGDVTVVDHVKLFQNLPHLRFDGRIHEQILPAIRRLDGHVEWSDVYVTHSGADYSPEGRIRKQERDLRILHKDLEERPAHPFVLFNLGMTYADGGDHDRAVTYLARGLMIAAPCESHVRKAYALLTGSLADLDQTRAAWEVCHKGLAINPKDPELLFRKGCLAHRFGWLEEAAESFREVLNGRPERYFSSVDTGILGPKSRHNLALVLLDMGKPKEAEEQWRILLEDDPEETLAWRCVVECMFQQGQAERADEEAAGYLSSPEMRSVGRLLRTEIARHRHDPAQIRRELEAALEENGDDPFALEQLCQVLFETDQMADAEQALARLSGLRPSDAAVHQNLGTVLFRLGKHQQAVASYERSLALRPGVATAEHYLREARKQVSLAPPDPTVGLLGPSVAAGT